MWLDTIKHASSLFLRSGTVQNYVPQQCKDFIKFTFICLWRISSAIRKMFDQKSKCLRKDHTKSILYDFSWRNKSAIIIIVKHYNNGKLFWDPNTDLIKHLRFLIRWQIAFIWLKSSICGREQKLKHICKLTQMEILIHDIII